MIKNLKLKYLYGDLSLFLVAIMWGGGFVAVKDALNSNISPYYMMTIRFSLSAIMLGIIFRKKLLNIKREDLLRGTILGILLFTSFAFQTVGLKYTTPGKQAFLTATYVVLVPFLTFVIYKKYPGWYSFSSGIIALIGIGLLTLQGPLRLGYGDSLTLICAIFFALHIMFVGKYSQKSDTIALSILQLGIAAIISAIFAVILERPPVGLQIGAYSSLLYLVIFSTMLAFLIQNVAQKYTLPSHAAIILSLESAFGSIFAVIFLKELFSSTMVIGCILIFISILISEIMPNLKRKL
ncbi:MAG TPA: DMT family transporter [Clostridiaceae bacterium]